MKGRKRDIRDLLVSGEYRPGRHQHQLPLHARAAYQRAGGGAAGCQAALEALAAGEDTLAELHRAAWATGGQLLAIQYGGDWPMSPERTALWREIDKARAVYRHAVVPDATYHVPIPPPEDDAEREELESALWERIHALADREA